MFVLQCSSFILSLLSLILFVVLYIIDKWNKKCKHFIHPKGPIGLPVVGHLPFLLMNPVNTLAKWQKRYGNVYKIKLGSWDTVVVNGFQSISDAARRSDDAFSSRPPFLTQRVLRNLNNEQESLVFAPFDASFIRHKHMTSSALRVLMKTDLDGMHDMISVEARKLADELISKYSSKEYPVEITDDVQSTIGTISYKLFLGGGDSFETDIDIDLDVTDIIETTKDIVLRIGAGNPVEVMPWLEYVLPWKSIKYKNLLERIARIRDGQISDHARTFDGGRVRDVIDAMLTLQTNGVNRKDKDNCSQERLLCTVQDFIGGSFSTSTALVTWFVKYMAAYPDVQEKAQAEVGVSRRMEYKDRYQLPYTEALFHEVLRMSCVLPFAFPHYTIKDTKLCGCDIKKDTVVIFNLHSIANDKEFWGDPETFRPERFLTADGLDRGKCNRVVAFGIGRRRCVGEELVRMKLFILFTTLLQKCTFIHEDEAINFQSVPNLVYEPKPFRVFVKKRLE